MEKLVGKGTRFIGIANHSPKMVDDILKAATIKPKIHQFEGHPYLRQDSFIDYNYKRNLTVVNYAPFGNMNPAYAASGASQPKMMQNKLMIEIAKARGCSGPSQVVLAWNLQRNVVVIPKALRKDHMVENFAALSCKLQKEDLDKIQAMKMNVRMLSYPCAMAANACFQGL
jgi:alcohol dehydrogenase (NADP+)